MKKIAVIIALFLAFLTGCTDSDSQLRRSITFREKLLHQSCSFVTEITAQYGDRSYSFTVQCNTDANGDLQFCVVMPESIAGITGTIVGNTGHLTFDDKALAFSLLADGEVSPVSAPWLLLKTLRSGYISSCGLDNDGLRISLDDSYEANALRLDVWLGEGDVPIFAEILWQGRRVLSMQIENFTFV